VWRETKRRLANPDSSLKEAINFVAKGKKTTKGSQKSNPEITNKALSPWSLPWHQQTK
jgi:hypothetical protein